MMKSLLALSVALAAVAIPSDAQEAKVVSGKVRCSKNSALILPEGTKYEMQDFGEIKTFAPVASNKVTADEEKVKVLINVTSARRPVKAQIYNKNFKTDFKFSRKDGVAEVPKGTYDLYVYFSGDKYSYVIKEDVQVTDEMALEISEDEATIPVEFHYFDENNRELLKTVKGEKDEIYIEGTADDMIKVSTINNKEYGIIYNIMSYGNKTKGHMEDFYISKVSNKYFVGQATHINVGSHNYEYKAVISDFNKPLYNSDPANLRKLVTGFTNSPKMKNHQYVGLPGVDFAYVLNDNLLCNIQSWGLADPKDDGKVITYIDCPTVKEGDDCNVNMMVRPLCTDSYEVVIDPYYDEEEEVFTSIVGPYAIGNAKEDIKYIVSGADLDFGFNIMEDGISFKYYPGHPEFSFVSADGIAHFGNNVPLLAYRSYKLGSGSEINAYDEFRYFGRYGEIRETDKKYAEIETQNTADGTLVKITNDNVEVDGIAGKNVTEVLYNMSKTDNTAPTFQMMTFKDAEGNICDRFDNTNGAKLLVAGGDFTYLDDPDSELLGYFTCSAPASAKAFCAPHGTENWTALTLVEKPELFFMPAFGNFYEADLSSVNVEAADTWFDVRLEMADADGNYQKQTISPAFKVATATSIDQVKAAAGNSLVVLGKRVTLADNDKADFTVRSIDGRTIQNAFANGVDLSGMGSGIYVVTAVLADGNALSTKIAL